MQHAVNRMTVLMLATGALLFLLADWSALCIKRRHHYKPDAAAVDARHEALFF
jgi:hypothetical protein